MEHPKPKPGRPVVPAAKSLKSFSIRLNEEQQTKVDALGGRIWIRNQIDAEPWPTAPTKKPPKGGS